MANILTVARMVIAVTLCFLSPKSIATGFLFLFAGLTDLLDGLIARKTNTVTSFGEKADSLADLLLLCVCGGKLLQAGVLSFPILLWACIIALLRLCRVFVGSPGRLLLPHSRANRIAGLLLFFLPFLLPFTGADVFAIPACIAASCAAVSDLLPNNSFRMKPAAGRNCSASPGKNRPIGRLPLIANPVRASSHPKQAGPDEKESCKKREGIVQ